MDLLVIVSLAYAAVLVLALAVSLIAILVALRLVSGVLADVRSVLGGVERHTRPLAPAIEALHAKLPGPGSRREDLPPQIESRRSGPVVVHR